MAQKITEQLRFNCLHVAMSKNSNSPDPYGILHAMVGNAEWRLQSGHSADGAEQLYGAPATKSGWIVIAALLIILMGCVIWYAWSAVEAQPLAVRDAHPQSGLTGSPLMNPVGVVQERSIPNVGVVPSIPVQFDVPKQMTADDLLILSGSKFSDDFEKLHKLAKDGNADLAFGLYSHLAECTAEKIQERESQTAESQENLTGFDDAVLVELKIIKRNSCIGIKPVQLAAASELLKLSEKFGNPRARLELASNAIEKLEELNLSYQAQSLNTDRSPLANDQTLLVKELEDLAGTGNPIAMSKLVRLFGSGLVVDANPDKQLQYMLVVNHDWQLPASEILKNPELQDIEAEDVARIGAMALQLFNSCCFGKSKKI